MPSRVATQAVLVRDHLFIGGEMVKPESDAVIEVVSPVTEERIGTAPCATRGDFDRAVRAARVAFDDGPWPRMSPPERAKRIGPLRRISPLPRAGDC